MPHVPGNIAGEDWQSQEEEKSGALPIQLGFGMRWGEGTFGTGEKLTSLHRLGPEKKAGGQENLGGL